MKTIPTTKHIYKLRRVRLRANSFEARFIQLSGSHGISSATARIRADANMIVATSKVTHNSTVLGKQIGKVSSVRFDIIVNKLTIKLTLALQ